MANSFVLHNGISLVISTPNAVLSLSRNKLAPIFRCADGIVSVKIAKDNSGLLAIADSHIVILRELRRKKDRNTRLQRTDGEVRILQFSHDSKTLYFTTSLTPCVQAYSLAESRLLLPLAHTHSSPPHVLACSNTSNVLLTASANPSTISFHNLHVHGPPMQFIPAASTAPVAWASFHPVNERFLLGFSDGCLAVYKSYFTKGWQELRAPVEVESHAKLHKASMGGIAAAEFVPAFEARIISVGKDGKCRLIDFGVGCTIIRTWYISSPASCLAILSPSKTMTEVRLNDAMEGPEVLAAVGARIGKVLIFNMLGLLIHEIQLDSAIICLECVHSSSNTILNPTRNEEELLSDCEVDSDMEGKEAETVRRHPVFIRRENVQGSPFRTPKPQDICSPTPFPTSSREAKERGDEHQENSRISPQRTRSVSIAPLAPTTQSLAPVEANTQNDEESGTVKRHVLASGGMTVQTSLPPKTASCDLLSPSSMSPELPLSPSKAKRPRKHRKSHHPRPRIRTETFVTPIKNQTFPVMSGALLSMSSPTGRSPSKPRSELFPAAVISSSPPESAWSDGPRLDVDDGLKERIMLREEHRTMKREIAGLRKEVKSLKRKIMARED